MYFLRRYAAGSVKFAHVPFSQGSAIYQLSLSPTEQLPRLVPSILIFTIDQNFLFQLSRKMSFSNAAKQIVVVVGAGPGLGFSVARKFAEQGHPVALLSRSKDRLESLASQINALSGDKKHGKAVAYAVDVQDEDSVIRTIEQVQDHFSSGKGGDEHQGAFIHTGVFNPGGGFVRAPFLETKASQVEDAFKTQV